MKNFIKTFIAASLMLAGANLQTVTLETLAKLENERMESLINNNLKRKFEPISGQYLFTLDLSNMNLFNLEDIQNLPSNDQIQMVDLSYNQLTHASPLFFQKFPNLLILDLSGNPLTDHNKTELLKALPKPIKIRFQPSMKPEMIEMRQTFDYRNPFGQ